MGLLMRAQFYQSGLLGQQISTYHREPHKTYIKRTELRGGVHIPGIVYLVYLLVHVGKIGSLVTSIHSETTY